MHDVLRVGAAVKNKLEKEKAVEFFWSGSHPFFISGEILFLFLIIKLGSQ